jgi:outer membrane protein
MPSVRPCATDEGVATALAGYRPRVTGTASLNEVYLDQVTRIPAPNPANNKYPRTFGENAMSSASITATQTLFNGLQTGNRTRQAESQVLAARETLRVTEQTVLLSAITAYMNLLRDAALRELQASNVNVLEATLRQTRLEMCSPTAIGARPSEDR